MTTDAPIVVAMISAAAAIVVPAVTFYFTKSKERHEDWLRYKFKMYKELVESLSGIMSSTSTPEGQVRFSEACNTLHLIGSRGVLQALHDFQDKTRSSGPPISMEEHDRLLSRLLWEIRCDLEIPENPALSDYKARLWSPGRNAGSPPPAKGAGND